jgi:hypothetical protein
VDLVFEEPKPEPSFAAEAGKAFTLAAIASAGSLVGMFAIACVAGWVSDRREKKRKARSAPLTNDN